MMGNPGQKFKVELHPNFVEIRLALCNGVSPAKLAERYELGIRSVQRYAASLSAETRAAMRIRQGPAPYDLEHLRQVESENIAARIVTVCAELTRQFLLATSHNDDIAAARMSRELVRWTELQERLYGDLAKAAGAIHLHIQASPEYRRLLAVLMAWSAKHPDLACELSEALHAVPPMIEIEGQVNGRLDD